MTALAVRDGIIAADSGLFSESHVIVGSCQKIDSVGNGWFIATAGNHADGIRVRDAMRRLQRPWMIKLTIFEQLTTECEGFLVGPTGVFNFRHDTGLEPTDFDFDACGAMDDFLYGAMAFGATAEQAVRLACQRHALAVAPVQVVRFARKKSQKGKKSPQNLEAVFKSKTAVIGRLPDFREKLSAKRA